MNNRLGSSNWGVGVDESLLPEADSDAAGVAVFLGSTASGHDGGCEGHDDDDDGWVQVKHSSMRDAESVCFVYRF